MMSFIQTETPQNLIGKVIAVIFTISMYGDDIGYIIYKMDDQVWISHWSWYGENKDIWWCEYIINVS
mgnify:CR=1 FL=1